MARGERLYIVIVVSKSRARAKITKLSRKGRTSNKEEGLGITKR